MIGDLIRLVLTNLPAFLFVAGMRGGTLPPSFFPIPTGRRGAGCNARR